MTRRYISIGEKDPRLFMRQVSCMQTLVVLSKSLEEKKSSLSLYPKEARLWEIHTRDREWKKWGDGQFVTSLGEVLGDVDPSLKRWGEESTWFYQCMMYPADSLRLLLVANTSVPPSDRSWWSSSWYVPIHGTWKWFRCEEKVSDWQADKH